jgi:hypothetical protein
MGSERSGRELVHPASHADMLSHYPGVSWPGLHTDYRNASSLWPVLDHCRDPFAVYSSNLDRWILLDQEILYKYARL